MILFRKLYKEANDEIKIDNQLIDNILNKSKLQKKKPLYKPVIYQIAAAVVLVIGCSTGISQLMKKPELETDKIIPVHDSSTEYEASHSPYASEKTVAGVTEEALPTDTGITAPAATTPSPVPQSSQTVKKEDSKTENKKTTEKPAETQNVVSVPQEQTETVHPVRKRTERKETEVTEIQPKQKTAQPEPETNADESTAEAVAESEEIAPANAPAVASEEISESAPEEVSRFMYSENSSETKSGGGGGGGSSSGGGSSAVDSSGGSSAGANVMNHLILPSGFSCTSSSSSYYKYSDNTGKSFSVYVNSKPSETAVFTFEYNGFSYYVTAVNMTDSEIQEIFAYIA